MTSEADWSAVAQAMDRAVNAGVFPGAVLLAARGEDVLFHAGFGSLEEGGPDVSTSTVYDVSSLTKPLVTAACLLTLAARGSLTLDQPVGEVLPAWCDGAGAPRRGVTIADLMAHRSGLPARSLYFDRVDGAPGGVVGSENADRVVRWALAEPLAAAPRSVSVYSDVGFIVLGAVVEAVAGAPLDEVFRIEFGATMSSGTGGFFALGSATMRDDVAPAGFCPWRGRVIRGEVQDENAWVMGGAAGHAGLFATAWDVHALTLEYFRANRGAPSLLDSELVRRVWNGPVAEDSTWALGWDTPTPGASSGGGRISRRSFGHLGFTGSSVWVDLERGVQIILLSNRVHPDPANVAIRTFRPELHDSIFETLDTISSAAAGKGDAQ